MTEQDHSFRLLCISVKNTVEKGHQLAPVVWRHNNTNLSVINITVEAMYCILMTCFWSMGYWVRCIKLSSTYTNRILSTLPVISQIHTRWELDSIFLQTKFQGAEAQASDWSALLRLWLYINLLMWCKKKKDPPVQLSWKYNLCIDEKNFFWTTEWLPLDADVQESMYRLFHRWCLWPCDVFLSVNSQLCLRIHNEETAIIKLYFIFTIC